MHWSGEHDRLTDKQVELHKSHLRRQSERELLHSYTLYLGALKLSKEGEPCSASKIQYFVEAWRELQRRKRVEPAQT